VALAGDRGATLGRFTFEWPRLDAAFAAAASGWLLIVVVAAAALWLLRGLRDALL